MSVSAEPVDGDPGQHDPGQHDPGEHDTFSPLHASNLRRNVVALVALTVVLGGSLAAAALLDGGPGDDEVAACRLVHTLPRDTATTPAGTDVLATLGDVQTRATDAGDHLLAATAADAQRSLNLAQAPGAVAERDTHLALFRAALADLDQACAGVR